MKKFLLNLGLCASLCAANPQAKPMAEWLKPIHEKAVNGDQYSQLLLGRLYMSGKGLQQNFVKSAELFMASAKSGNSEACFELGRFYESGFAFRQSFSEAAKWYRKGAAAQDPKSMYSLARLVTGKKVKAEKGENAQKLFLESYKAMKRMAEEGNEEAYYYLGKMNFLGWGVVRHPREGRDFFEKGAAANDAASQYEYAQFFLKGMLVAQDTEAGMKLLQASSRSSYAPATKMFMRLMESGDLHNRVSPDPKRAKDLRKQLADMGHSHYQYEFAMNLLKFSPSDFRLIGFSYLEKAASQQFMPAEFKLSEILIYGKYGVGQDVDQGMRFLRSAAHGGYPKARVLLQDLTGELKPNK